MSEERGMEQVQSDTQSLKMLYEFINKGPTDEIVRHDPCLVDCPFFAP
jgi:hypothetical protein